MTQATEISPAVVKTDEIVGIDVVNAKQEDLGKIAEIIIDKFSGQVCYVVLSFGGFLGVGNKLFAIPWNALHYDEDADCFRLDIEKDKLEKAPGFDKNHWPDMTDKNWGQSIYEFYGTKPYWKG